MPRELVNYVNYIGRVRICLVTKIKNGPLEGENFNLQNKTNDCSRYAVHNVHMFTGHKLAFLGISRLIRVVFQVFYSIFCEYIEYLLTIVRARLIFAPEYIEAKTGICELCEYSVFEVHKIQSLNFGGGKHVSMD